eukprot:s3520_g8.t1
MPTPWVQNSLNPGWLASQKYPPGTIIEFEAYDGGAKARGRALATVTQTRGRGSAGTWLAIRVQCVAQKDFVHWLGKGPVADRRGGLELHICLHEVCQCALREGERYAELHTDTLLTVDTGDLMNRVTDWWTTEPAAGDFESFRRRLLDKDGPTVVPQARAAAPSDRNRTDDDESEVPPAPSPRAGQGRRDSSRPHGLSLPVEKRAGEDEQPFRTRTRLPAEHASHHHERRHGQEGIRSPRGRGDDERTDRSHGRSSSSERGRGRLPQRRGAQKGPRRARETDHCDRAASSGRISYGKEAERKRETPSPVTRSRSRRRRRAVRERSNETGRESRSPQNRGRSRTSSRRRRASQRPRPAVDLLPSMSGERESSQEMGSRSHLRLVEAEDWISRDLAAIGTSEDEAPWDTLTSAVVVTEPFAEMRSRAKAILTKGYSYGRVGGELAELLLSLTSPMGDFLRQYCSTQPPQAVRPYSRRRGEVLPIHPSAITVELEGINSENLHWVRATTMVLNYIYCRGRVKPTGVPISPQLGANQRKAIRSIAVRTDRFLGRENLMPTPTEVSAALEGVGSGEMGAPVKLLRELEADAVIASWPPVGATVPISIVGLLDERLMNAVRDPTGWWLPDDLRPQKRTRCEVMADDGAWYRICQAAHCRGLMKVISDDYLHKDREGHFITAGAGGVCLGMPPNDGRDPGQEFFPIMDAVNEHSGRLPGEHDAVRFGGLLETIVALEGGTIYAGPGQLADVISAFSVPDSWLPHFAFSKRVCASAFGGSPGTQVRPAWCRLPGAWQNSLTLVEAALCEMTLTRCGVPRAVPGLQQEGSLRELPPGVSCSSSIYELKRLREFGQSLGPGAQTQHGRRFEALCGSLKLPLEVAKDMLKSLTRGLDGLALGEDDGCLMVTAKVLREFVCLSLGLLQSPVWKVMHLRRWMGKALFISTVHRLQRSILGALLARLERGSQEDFTPGSEELEEVICVMMLSLQAVYPLKLNISGEISKKSATPTGGVGASATAFLDRSLEVPHAVTSRGECVACGQTLEGREQSVFPCPRACGELGCSIRCAQAHFEAGDCSRKSFAVPRFGERFAGPRYPLTTAVALAGGAVQRPLDLRINDNAWDYFTPQGKEALEYLEEDPALRWRHWSPDSITFMKSCPQASYPARTDKGKGKPSKPPKLRTVEQPWGVDRMNRDDHVVVRQENKMAKRSLKGLETADRQGGFAALEHPYDSFLWDTEEVEDIKSRPGFMVSSWSHCCFGGKKTWWTSLLHNSPRVHQALHRPRCACVSPRGRADTQSKGKQREMEGADDEEYPWRLCVAYAEAILADQRALMIPPLGTAQFDLPHVLYNQIMGAVRGLQSEDLVYALVLEVDNMVRHMDLGDENRHLSTFVLKHWLKGTDPNLMGPRELINGRGVLSPYPAFRWDWHTRACHTWQSNQRPEVMQLMSIFAELCRRAQKCENFGQVYVNVTECVNSLRPTPHCVVTMAEAADAVGAEGTQSVMQGQANLTAAREARKRAELDAQLLANRIALLKQEEEKAWKKIEETKKRAAEIVKLREQNEQKFSAKEQFYKQKWESIRAAQATNAQQREKAKAIREQTRHGLMEQKLLNAQSTKQQSQHMLLQKKEREAVQRFSGEGFTLSVPVSTLGHEVYQLVSERLLSKPGTRLLIHHGASRFLGNQTLQQQGIGNFATLSCTFVRIDLYAAWCCVMGTAEAALEGVTELEGIKGGEYLHHLPDSLESLTFGHEFNQNLNGVMLPSSLRNLTFGYQFDQSLDGLPSNLRSLSLGPTSRFNQSLERVIWPESLESLTLGSGFNQSLAGISWPSNLKSLTLGVSFNQSLENVTLPSGLQSLTFSHHFNQSLDNVSWPKNLQSLRFGQRFDQNIERTTWPQSLQSLTFGGRFDQSLKHVDFPASLQDLTFGHRFNQTWEGVKMPNLQSLKLGASFNQNMEKVSLPHSLKSFTFGGEFDGSLELLSLPAGLQSLTFGNAFDHSLEGAAWPTNLQHLTFGFGFDESLVRATLPNGLQSLTFGFCFNQSLEGITLPSNLQSLTFGERFNKSLEHVIFPASLQSLTFGEAFNQGLERVTFPSSLQNLTFDYSFNQSLDEVTWPIGLKRLTFGSDFNQSLVNVTFPSSLQSLTLGCDFNQSLLGVTLPHGLESLTLGNGFSQSMEAVTLPHLRRLTFGLSYDLQPMALPDTLPRGRPTWNGHPI